MTAEVLKARGIPGLWGERNRRCCDKTTRWFFALFFASRRVTFFPERSNHRLSKKPVIASQSADWRGNPFKMHNLCVFMQICG